ncbi:MAG: type pilus assembly protein PilA [Actinomycetota bacterium]|jgi:type IV pilus assembly protein PilA|nr:type pilus assembly protein PilA [Actinomycetota bacterium]
MSLRRQLSSRSGVPLATPNRDADGFTLIELMVVVLIIAILIAIAIPTFLGARGRAQDRAAQSDLRNALTAQKTLFTDAQTYLSTGTAANITTLKGVEGSLSWAATASTASKSLSAAVGDAAVVGDKGSVCMSEYSKSGTLFSIADVAAGGQAGTYFGKVACPATPTAANIVTTLGTNPW